MTRLMDVLESLEEHVVNSKEGKEPQKLKRAVGLYPTGGQSFEEKL